MSKIPISWLIYALERSHLVFGMTLAGVTAQQAQQLRDGPDGWNILEIVCHVRDSQGIYFERARRMVTENCPVFVAHDRLAMVIENDYAHQDLKAVFDDFVMTRQRFIAFVSGLERDQWLRPGVHPSEGEIDVTVPTYHTIMHDVDHSEQIMRVLGKKLP